MRWEGIACKGSDKWLESDAPMQHHESTRLVGSKHNDRELLNLLQPEQMKLASPQDLVLLVPQLQSEISLTFVTSLLGLYLNLNFLQEDIPQE